MEHRISQLDGVDDIKLNKNKENNKPVENSCALCKEGGRFCTETCKDPCEGCEEVRNQTESDNIYYIMKQYEPKEVLKHFGHEYITTHQHTIWRRLDYVQEAQHSAKWDLIL